MDDCRFDRLVKTFSAPDTRRGVLQVLATFPLFGGLASFLGDDEDAEAKGRRKRRKKRHKHGKGRRRKRHKKPCKAKSRTKTCAGKCGIVRNRCKKTVN